MDADLACREKARRNRSRMLRAILNKSSKQRPTNQQLYRYLPPISKAIQIRRTRHAGHCWRNNWRTQKRHYSMDPFSRMCKCCTTNLNLYATTLYGECSLRDRQKTMDDRDGWRKRVRKIFASSWTWSHTHTHTRIYIHTHTQTHTYTQTHTQTYIYIYIYIYIWVVTVVGNGHCHLCSNPG